MKRMVAVVGALAVLNGFAAERRLSMDEYRARMRAAWEGQIRHPRRLGHRLQCVVRLRRPLHGARSGGH